MFATPASTPVLGLAPHALHAGKVAVWIAPNGTGKTRALLQIAGRLTPAPGGVLVFGETPAHHKRRVTLLTDDAGLLEAARIRDTLAWAAWLAGLTRVQARPRLETLAEYLHFDDAFLARPTAQCSRGEQRTVALAMALVATAPLVLLDEPFAGLDDAHAARAARAIDWRATEGAAVLVTSPTDPPVLRDAERWRTDTPR